MSSRIEILRVKNLTSTLDLFVASTSEEVDVVEFDEQGIVVVLPSKRPQTGHLVSIDGRIFIGKQISPFIATGRIAVAANETIDPALARVRIQLGQFERDLWARFLAAKKEEQEKVDALLARMSGDS